MITFLLLLLGISATALLFVWLLIRGAMPADMPNDDGETM